MFDWTESLASDLPVGTPEVGFTDEIPPGFVAVIRAFAALSASSVDSFVTAISGYKIAEQVSNSE